MLQRGLTALMLLLLGLRLVSDADAAPKVALPETTFDFGMIQEGEKVTHVFTIVNAGDEPLQIMEVKADCGCTATSLSHTSLPPKQAGEVKVVFDSRNRVGNFQKNVRIFTNDPQQPTSLVTIRGNVHRGPVPSLMVPSRKLDFGVISLNCPFEFDLEVHNEGTENLVISSIKNLRGELLLNSEKTIAPQGKETLRLTYRPAMPGIINESLTLYSNDPNNPQYYVFLTGYVDREEKVTLYDPRGQSMEVANSTGHRIILSSKGGSAQTVEPYQRTTIVFDGQDVRRELSVIFEAEERRKAQGSKEGAESARKWYQIFD